MGKQKVSKKRSKNRTASRPPAEQETRPKGEFPSREHQFKPGESGNPDGRPPSAGASVREWVNKLSAQNLSAKELRKMATDDSIPWAQQTAAIRMTRTTERGDMADFVEVLKGHKDLEELRKSGVNTELVKRCKVTTRTEEYEGEEVEVAEVHLELHDRSGADFDRILDRTDGRPRQRVDLAGIPGGANAVPPQIIVEVLDGADVAERYPHDKPAGSGAADEDD